MGGPELIPEDPPLDARGRPSLITPWLLALRDHPGVWHRYPHLVSSRLATDISRGRRTGIASGEFEATARGVKSESSRFHLWARYVGGDE